MCRQKSRLNRESILDAAAASFYAKGYRETTLACVAKQLAVTDKALYYYFESKDCLYLHTLQVSAEQIAAVIASIDETPSSGSDKIIAFFRAMIRQPENLHLFIGGVPPHLAATEQGRRIRAAEYARDKILIGWIDDGIADGSIPPGDAKVLWKWNLGGLIWLDSWSRREKENGQWLRYEDHAIAMLDQSLSAGSRF